MARKKGKCIQCGAQRPKLFLIFLSVETKTTIRREPTDVADTAEYDDEVDGDEDDG